MSRNLARPLATGAAFMLVSACAPTSPLLRDASVTGAWGGEHVRLQLAPAGAPSITTARTVPSPGRSARTARRAL